MSECLTQERLRWNWLMQTFQGLRDGKLRDKIFERAASHFDSERPDISMHEALVYYGVTIKGTDPYPPHIPLPTDAGIEEYNDIIAAQELMNEHGANGI